MFKVVLNDGQSEMPDDDIYYVIGKEGVYLKKKLGVMESLAPVNKISILQSVATSATMHINPIPGKWIAKVMSFFHEIYKMYRSEAIVLLFYNEETGKHKIIPPMQKVAGAACDYDKGITIEGYTMIGTIHSHGSMSAFHSGTDDKDEEHFDGLHITLGDLDEAYPSISASIVANGFRVMIEPSEYIDNLALMSETNQIDGKAVTTKYKIVDGALVEDIQPKAKFTYAYAYKKYDRRYGVLVSDRDRIFNKKWLKMVEKGTYTYKSYRGGQQSFYGYGGYYGYTGQQPGMVVKPGTVVRPGNAWGDNYDAHAWHQAGLPIKSGVKTSPLNVGVAVEPLKFPAHTPEGEFIPCVTCSHRMCKLTSEIEEDDYDDDIYECIQCGELVTDTGNEMELKCSQCNTDDHLVLIVDGNLTDNYTPSDEFDHLFKKDIPEQSDYVKCGECGNGFHMFEDDALCPFCYTPVKPELYSTEEALETQSLTDSGAYLAPDQKEVNDAALAAAREADETIERIPEPGSATIPISKKNDGVLMSLFKKVFNGERENE